MFESKFVQININLKDFFLYGTRDGKLASLANNYSDHHRNYQIYMCLQ